MLARMSQQSRGEFFPCLQFESEATQKFRLVLAVAMRGREKVMRNLPAGQLSVEVLAAQQHRQARHICRTKTKI
jgi:hypothetical protein